VIIDPRRVADLPMSTRKEFTRRGGQFAIRNVFIP
jgi:hypothetical protein